MKKNDLTGRVFDKLKVIEEAEPYVSPKEHRKLMWRCQCECGNICEVMGSHLLSGHSASCGCQKTAKLKPRTACDLRGREFGMLKVIDRAENRMIGQNSRVVWRCRCECGKETEVLALLLTGHLTKSCGCSSTSHAERVMHAYLNERSAVFIAEYKVDGLCGVGGGALKFDFAVFDGDALALLIELDGVQHYRPVKYFGGTVKYEQCKANDSLKDAWAEQHGVTLVRINVSECRSDDDFRNLYASVLNTYHILN